MFRSTKKWVLSGVLILITLPLVSMQVVRDNSALREGPAVFLNAIAYLQRGTDIKRLSESDDGLWMEVRVNDQTGWIATTAIGDNVSKKSSAATSFPSAGGKLPLGIGSEQLESTLFGGSLQTITPGSYTAAVKGFAENYVQASGGQVVNMEPLLKMTEFTIKEYRKIRRKHGLNAVPRRKDFINGENPTVTTRMEKVGLAVSMAVLADGVVSDQVKTKKINIIANALNNQTRNYATRIRCWILPDSRPGSYSAPAGYIFISSGLLSILDNDDQLIAIIAHELGHLAIGHGSTDLQTEQIKNTATDAVKKLETSILEMGGSTEEVSAELRKEADRSFEGFKLVMDDIQEYEADAFAVKLLRKNNISKKSIRQVLEKIMNSTIDKEPRYSTQMQKRLARI